MRISVPHLVARLVVAPIVAPFLSAHPDIVLEVIANDAFVDIVKQWFDALIRLGESLDKDMTAVAVTPEFQTAILASPDYLARYGRRQSPPDLQTHACIRHRSSSGAVYRWQLESQGQRSIVQVNDHFSATTMGRPAPCYPLHRVGAVGLGWPERCAIRRSRSGRFCSIGRGSIQHTDAGGFVLSAFLLLPGSSTDRNTAEGFGFVCRSVWRQTGHGGEVALGLCLAVSGGLSGFSCVGGHNG